ncbi:beta-eliminating lyase-related protein [Kitasatospora sp. NBC_01287]|uniref:threonine aldolase family protein n=1 Tax=Kitasatospora sp. NBC_01287 TaxID=2903573 RepID=UPI00225A51D8|nr:beta-eliminating lyase-related protein [Kitasatospora sp. NBC_01287]MCX4748265.1 beta-eliminating lyase-related protein [Kitasatospora sp. NBC_01287]
MAYESNKWNESNGRSDAVLGPADRRFALWRAGHRILSGPRPVTLHERLAELGADARTAVGPLERPDFYGDGVVAELERRVAGLLGKPAALFFPTGTMAQQVALRCWARRRPDPVVATHPLFHLETHERRAHQRLTGLDAVWPTTAPRLPTAAELRDFDEPFGILMIELPLRAAGFVLPPWSELTALVAAARERGAVVHLDGARLWEAAAHYGRPLPHLAALADSVYVSFYKALGGISGAALAGGEELIREARTWRHRYGGLLYQQWPAALSALAALGRELPRLPGYLSQAQVIAKGLREVLPQVPGGRLNPDPPHTHQFQLLLPHPPERLTEANLRHAELTGDALFGTWSESGHVGLALTEVTALAPALAWNSAQVSDSFSGFLKLLGPSRG